MKTAALAILALAILIQTVPASAQAPAAGKTSNDSGAKAQETASTPNQAGTTLKDETQKFSYALGMNLGNNLRVQSVQIDTDLVLQGIKDGLAGGKTLMTEEEARAAIMQLQNELRAKQQEKMREAAFKNKADGEAFLEANKSKPGVVVLPSGLQYKVLTPGTGPKPTATDTVVCNYRGTLIDGTEFDSSEKHGGPATFPVSGVIKGWTEALQLMPVGSKWQLFVPAILAYGERGAGQIEPDSTLIFDVELVSIKAKENK